MREAARWAHLRRDFHNFWTSTKSEIAREALDRIGNIYDVERDINGQVAGVRHAARQKLSLPKVVAYFAWSEQQLLRIPGKGDLADILDRIHDHKINRLDELLPWNWAPLAAAHPEAN